MMRPPARSPFHVRLLDPSAICRQCTARLPRAPFVDLSRQCPRRSLVSASSARLNATYFLQNNALERVGAGDGRRVLQVGGHRRSSSATATGSSSSSASTYFTSNANPSSPPSPSSSAPPDTGRTDFQAPQNAELPPHRRRQARRKEAAVAASASASTAGSGETASAASSSSSSSSSEVLPSEDASSHLTTVAARLPIRSLRRNFSAFLSLSKPRLTVLVVLTAMVPYALYPVPSLLTPAVTESPSLSPLTLFFLTTGTALCSAAANSLNMLYEPATDALMSRTRNRPLVRKLVSRRGALLFAALSAAVGTAALYFGVNPTVSFLGTANIALYAGVYTPLKAVTALNTWVGALVGGIPPLMGWAAAAGESATADGDWRELLLAPDGSSLGGWLFGGLLFAWQFPHFMALSWSIRDEYRAAGLRMLAWSNPARNARVALRYSLAFFPLCLGLCAAGVTEWSFALTSAPVNGWLTWQAVRFWRRGGHGGSARGLFWASVWQLPGVMVLALLQKKGMWSRVWSSIVGEARDEDDDWEDDELDEMPVASPPSKS